jgi:hypothetical protein
MISFGFLLTPGFQKIYDIFSFLSIEIHFSSYPYCYRTAENNWRNKFQYLGIITRKAQKYLLYVLEARRRE